MKIHIKRVYPIDSSFSRTFKVILTLTDKVFYDGQFTYNYTGIEGDSDRRELLTKAEAINIAEQLFSELELDLAVGDEIIIDD